MSVTSDMLDKMLEIIKLNYEEDKTLFLERCNGDNPPTLSVWTTTIIDLILECENESDINIIKGRLLAAATICLLTVEFYNE